jgi:hypothetical protein
MMFSSVIFNAACEVNLLLMGKEPKSALAGRQALGGDA